MRTCRDENSCRSVLYCKSKRKNRQENILPCKSTLCLRSTRAAQKRNAEQILYWLSAWRVKVLAQLTNIFPTSITSSMKEWSDL